jgi:predicted alpha/beta-fold hydrolase
MDSRNPISAADFVRQGWQISARREIIRELKRLRIGESISRGRDCPPGEVRRSRVVNDGWGLWRWTMMHAETHFSAADGLSLYEQCWLPDGPAQAVVVMVHGVNEHSGRYARLASDLNRQGYAVYMMDLRGHGRSDGARVMVRSFDDYLADVELLLQRVAEREAGKPIFLLGHSMGGAIVALLSIERPPEVRGVILSSPAL